MSHAYDGLQKRKYLSNIASDSFEFDEFSKENFIKNFSSHYNQTFDEFNGKFTVQLRRNSRRWKFACIHTNILQETRYQYHLQ